MPFAPKRFCSHANCPVLVDKGRCPKHEEQFREDRKRYGRQTAARRGYDARWQKFRAAFLASNVLCLDCKELIPPRVTIATEVHHVAKVRDAPEHILDPANCRALCKTHHQIRTARGE